MAGLRRRLTAGQRTAGKEMRRATRGQVQTPAGERRGLCGGAVAEDSTSWMINQA